MTAEFDVLAIGNAIVDVIAPCTPDFLEREGLDVGAMTLIPASRAETLYARMAAGVESSGGSAANTAAGVASFGGRAAFIGKVAEDALGEVFSQDMNATGVAFASVPLRHGPSTARCLVHVTPDGQRTMCTYLGACVELTVADVDPALVTSAAIVYLEGYLFDPPQAREAFAKAARAARDAGRRIALSLSDPFVADRHREALLTFIETDVDIVFANAAEVCALFDTQDLTAARRALGQRVEIAAVTEGPHGSKVLHGERVVGIGAAPVNPVVDTTGAGDQYAAGFLFGLARGLDLAECGALGAMAAAEVISHYGSRPKMALAELGRQKGLLAA